MKSRPPLAENGSAAVTLPSPFIERTNAFMKKWGQKREIAEHENTNNNIKHCFPSTALYACTSIRFRSLKIYFKK